MREAAVQAAGLFVAGTFGRKGEAGPTVGDLGDVATSAEGAADRAGVIVDIPVAIEMLLDLRCHPHGTVAVFDGKRGAEGCQLRLVPVIPGVVKSASLLGTAEETLDEIHGDHGGGVDVSAPCSDNRGARHGRGSAQSGAGMVSHSDLSSAISRAEAPASSSLKTVASRSAPNPLGLKPNQPIDLIGAS